MLEGILRIIKRDGHLSRSRLAGDPGMIDGAIDELLKRGYLLEEKTSEGCSTFCSSCPFAKNCSKEIIKAYQISDKGNRLLEQSQLYPPLEGPGR